MSKVNRLTTIARNLVLGVLAVGATTLMLPGSAEARPGPQKVAHALERIAYDASRIRDIRGLRRQDAAIDRLQARLHRLDRITDHQRGRRARRNDATIDRLQHRLNRMERRIEARMERRRGHRRDDRRAAYRDGRLDGHRDGHRDDRLDGHRDHRRDDRHDGRRDRGFGGSTFGFGSGWRY